MSTIGEKELQTLHDKIFEKGYIDREHLLEFLTLIPTNDGDKIVEEVENWLKKLNDSPRFSNISFPMGDISAILGDLASYGRVQPETVLRFQEESNRNMIK